MVDIFGAAVFDGLFTKLTRVVLRLISGVFKNTAQFYNSIHNTLSYYQLHIILEYVRVPPYTNSR